MITFKGNKKDLEEMGFVFDSIKHAYKLGSSDLGTDILVSKNMSVEFANLGLEKSEILLNTVKTGVSVINKFETLVFDKKDNQFVMYNPDAHDPIFSFIQKNDDNIKLHGRSFITREKVAIEKDSINENFHLRETGLELLNKIQELIDKNLI